jgi:gluconolactonase
MSRSGTLFLASGVVIWGTLAVLSACGPNPENHTNPESGTIIRLDPRFNELIPADAKVEKIADGFTWVEGPVWNKQGQYLLFSDIPANTVFKWKEGKGVSPFLKPAATPAPSPLPEKSGARMG